MNNTIVIQQARLDNGSVKPLLASRIKQIINRADLVAITELQTEADRLWDEMAAFARAPRLINEARAALRSEMTAASRERVDALEAQYPSTEYCEKEHDLRQSQLNVIQAKTPAVVYPALRRIQKVLGDIKEEIETAAAKEFEAVGMVYGDGDASPILLMVKLAIFNIELVTAKVRAGKHICAEFPSSALDQYFDWATVKKESLSPTLPVPRDEPATPPYSRPADTFPAKGTAKRDIPGVTFLGYGGGQPETINSDGEFSRQMATVAALPPR